MTPFFEQPSSIQDLSIAAAAWKGTPWQENCRIRGVGASCHFACWGVYADAGWDCEDVPTGDPAWGSANTTSQFEAWLDRQPFFLPVGLSDLRPGDLLGFQILGCIDHCGILLPDFEVFHSLRHSGARIHKFRTLQRYARRAWRPLHS